MLVVIVALVGFWDWRAAMLMAASIPLTLAMAFGICQVMGIDIQQVSIATLIIALGLLVDMPVVAGDAIKRELGQGIAAQPRVLDRPEQARQGHHLRHHHQHRRLPAVPAADRRHLLLPLQPAGRDERDAGRLGDRLVHLHPARRLLPDQAAEAGRGAHVRAAQARLRRVLLPRRRFRAPAPLGGVRGLAEHPGRGLALHVAAAPAVLPQGPVVPLVRGRLGAFRRAARGDERDRAQGRSRDPRGGGALRRGAPREGRPEDAHHVRGRRRAAVLVLGRSRAPAAELCPDPHRGRATSTSRTSWSARCRPRSAARCPGRGSTSGSSRRASRSGSRSPSASRAPIRRSCTGSPSELQAIFRAQAGAEPGAGRLGRAHDDACGSRWTPTAPTSRA